MSHCGIGCLLAGQASWKLLNSIMISSAMERLYFSGFQHRSDGSFVWNNHPRLEPLVKYIHSIMGIVLASYFKHILVVLPFSVRLLWKSHKQIYHQCFPCREKLFPMAHSDGIVWTTHDKASACISRTPGGWTRTNWIPFLSHNFRSQITSCIEMNDLFLPSLLMYNTAVELLHISHTTWDSRWGKNPLTARRTASSSNTLVCCALSLSPLSLKGVLAQLSSPSSYGSIGVECNFHL